MKKLLFILFCLLSIQTFAKNKITYLKMQRTSCYGKCPSYTVEFLKTGEVIYNGRSHTKMTGIHRAKMTKAQTAAFFRQFESYTYGKLAAKYPVMSTDLPGMNIDIIVNGKRKSVKHAEAGPRFLTQIGADVDDKVKTLKWKAEKPVAEVYEIEAPPMEVVVDAPVEEIFEFTEQSPEFPGGDAAMKNYLSKNIQYPPMAKETGIEGRVICTFVVYTDGSVGDVKVLKSLVADCDKEAVRVIKNMPRWKPGKQNGRAVNVKYNLPIFFKLQ